MDNTDRPPYLITITRDTGGQHASEDTTPSPDAVPTVRHVAEIVAESRQIIARIARRRLELLDLQRAVADRPEGHPEVRPARARMDLLVAGIEGDSRLLHLLSQELRYASAF
jgi:hypothetical protein